MAWKTPSWIASSRFDELAHPGRLDPVLRLGQLALRHALALAAVVLPLSAPAVVATAIDLASGDFESKVTQQDYKYMEGILRWT